MTFTRRREALRAMLAGSACLHPASTHDPLSARIAEGLGYELGMLAGSTASLAILGAPDHILITLGEFAEQARRVCRAAATLPILADADHGYGNALNAARTAQELEAAGIAGFSIEDTELPRPFGAAQPRLVGIAEGVGKVRAACEARMDRATCVFARTGAMSISGLEDCLERVRAYNASGADAIFLTGVTARAQLDAVAEAAALPLVLGTLSAEIRDNAYLASRGVRVALLGHAPSQAAAQAVHDALLALREGRPVGALPAKADWARWTREAEYEAEMARYLG
ncbi:oxaloacetate decarboxylase [Roseococcus sp. DSY-14]|uniref:isocitrate lyase/PEP mutase family protein n=1 Tax=Roseococcus sp. DSY-14 TaxID=3369650 RepID=UPI00387B46A3